ncbi:uncharacterized protein LOC113765501 [Coffea eugenioides]|uniref:uncharacterized protein LOC113765501 n=1 Tax=Coffea eugenioides TaxID=49369 RepID=UPI000F605BF1|nr:uncharacterized protein LOC113765501 [Coffea eugenioides]
MGQAIRRAAGRIGSTKVDTTPSQLKESVEVRPPPEKLKVDNAGSASTGSMPKVNSENVLEERDPQYDSMLGHMVGRIRTKPGGKLEMGEAFVVEKYDRPLPKVRNTTPESGRYEERPALPGTLNVAQLRHIMLLYQGKADDHNGPMRITQIAERFRIDVAQVEKILQFVSLPPEDSRRKKNDQY